MSRSLKFRAWDKKYKQAIPLRHASIRLDGKLDLPPHYDEENVIIEQYTGLKDKNGKEIYEGDIVKCWHEDCGEVYFDTIFLEYRVKFSDVDDENLASSEPEIIGNIHENPELLGGEDA